MEFGQQMAALYYTFWDDGTNLDQQRRDAVWLKRFVSRFCAMKKKQQNDRKQFVLFFLYFPLTTSANFWWFLNLHPLESESEIHTKFILKSTLLCISRDTFSIVA